MYIGSHGFGHYWLNYISENEQKKEIDLSLQFLRSIGSDTKRWIMCYPYGDYNNDTLEILKKLNCVIGITTKVDKVLLGESDPLQYSRFDTNDYPQ